MGNAVRLMGMTALASVAMMITGGVSAQVSGVSNPNGPPAMPKAVSPQPKPAVVVPLVDSSSSSQRGPLTNAASDARQRNTLRSITEKKAELELLKIQADIDKYKKPQEDAAKKEEALNLQAALDQAKKEQAALPQSRAVTVAVDPGPPVLLLATFGSPELPSLGYAEFKVGDLLVHAKVGDRLPSGHYLKAVNFDSVEVSKSKTAKVGKVIYISPADAASVYGSRAKSGSAVEAATTSPSGAQLGIQTVPNVLPPMPGSR